MSNVLFKTVVPPSSIAGLRAILEKINKQPPFETKREEELYIKAIEKEVAELFRY